MADWCDIDFANGDANPLQSAYKDVTKITMKNMYENITFAGNHIFEETVDNFNNRFYTFRISDDVKVIKPYAFYCIGASSIEIPGTVEEIGESAFGEIRILGTSSYSEMERVVTFEKGEKPLVSKGSLSAPPGGRMKTVVWSTHLSRGKRIMAGNCPAPAVLTITYKR